MARELWWVWMVVAAVFAVGEIFTAGFFLLWFAIGAAVAGILTLLGFGMGWQLATFAIVSGALFVASRRFAERWTQKQPSGVGADRFIGKTGVVLAQIDNLKATGRIRVERDEWRAESETGEVITPGTVVTVVRVEGTRMVVRILMEEK